MDIWSKEKRSEVMGRIRSKNTKPEMILRSALFQLGYRYRIHKEGLPGKPDIVLARYRTVIFVQGCFWHCHSDCNEGKIPSTNSKFWKAKLSKNILRDELNMAELQKLNWNVMIVWECTLQGKKSNDTILNVVKQIETNGTL